MEMHKHRHRHLDHVGSHPVLGHLDHVVRESSPWAFITSKSILNSKFARSCLEKVWNGERILLSLYINNLEDFMILNWWEKAELNVFLMMHAFSQNFAECYIHVGKFEALWMWSFSMYKKPFHEPKWQKDLGVILFSWCFLGFCRCCCCCLGVLFVCLFILLSSSQTGNKQLIWTETKKLAFLWSRCYG